MMKNGLRAALLGSALVVWSPASAGPSAQSPAAVNPYQPLAAWAQLPAGMEFGQVSGVELDARGDIWVIHRADPPILEFDRCAGRHALRCRR